MLSYELNVFTGQRSASIYKNGNNHCNISVFVAVFKSFAVFIFVYSFHSLQLASSIDPQDVCNVIQLQQTTWEYMPVLSCENKHTQKLNSWSCHQDLKDKDGIKLDLCYSHQIPWKNQNQRCINLNTCRLWHSAQSPFSPTEGLNL